MSGRYNPAVASSGSPYVPLLLAAAMGLTAFCAFCMAGPGLGRRRHRRRDAGEHSADSLQLPVQGEHTAEWLQLPVQGQRDACTQAGSTPFDAVSPLPSAPVVLPMLRCAAALLGRLCRHAISSCNAYEAERAAIHAAC